MSFDEVRSAVAKLESDVASGPIVPAVTAHEIRRYLAARYDFTEPLALDEVGADVDRMLRTWQVQVTHPRYFGLFNPSVTLASIIGGHAGRDVQPAAGDLADLTRGVHASRASGPPSRTSSGWCVRWAGSGSARPAGLP